MVGIPVCIFAKPPVPGEVKTRLIPVLGAAGAAELASAMLLDAWRIVESCAGVRPILATTRSGDLPMSVACEDVWLQGEGDLRAPQEQGRQGGEEGVAPLIVQLQEVNELADALGRW